MIHSARDQKYKVDSHIKKPGLGDGLVGKALSL